MPAWFDLLKDKNMMLATAESCTGGQIAKTVTDYAGSSAVFERGFVTYTNQSKTELLAVPEDILEQHGAVSAPVARLMAAGALARSHADVALSCTGIAGPDGGTETKPVGLVYIGLAVRNGAAQSFEHHFDGDREAVRTQTVAAALKHLEDALT